MTEHRRSTDHADSRRDRRTIALVAALAAVAVAVAFAAAGFALWLNAGRTQQIQQERATNIQRSCEEQNDKHDNTIRALDQLLERASRSASREQVQRSRASTTLLINALAPKRDCEALVRLQVDTK